MWSNEIELISDKYCEFELFFYEISTILQNAGIEKRRDYTGRDDFYQFFSLSRWMYVPSNEFIFRCILSIFNWNISWFTTKSNLIIGTQGEKFLVCGVSGGVFGSNPSWPPLSEKEQLTYHASIFLENCPPLPTPAPIVPAFTTLTFCYKYYQTVFTV